MEHYVPWSIYISKSHNELSTTKSPLPIFSTATGPVTSWFAADLVLASSRPNGAEQA